MHLLLVRSFFAILMVGLATSALVTIADKDQLALGIVAFVVFVLVGAATVATDIAVRNKQITTISAVYFGLVLGFLLGSFLWAALEPMFSEALGRYSGGLILLVRFLITLVCCYVTVSTLLQTKDEFRFIIPYVEFSKQMKGGRPLVLDTSVIIDGRIADICDTRIIDTKLIVPRFVLQELQHIADSGDKLKRNRGRRGLDMLKKMQGNPDVELEVHEGNIPELREVHKVDERLVVLAKALNARVVTNDYNLNKVAQLQGVEVINLNEIANALKSVALPGEAMAVRIVKPGDQAGQGVGYLPDGTMIVVEGGRAHVGQDVTIAVTSVLQNPAGRMIFGRIEGRPPAPASPPPPSPPAGAEPQRVESTSD